MTIETDDILKKALLIKLEKILNAIPIELEMLNIRSTSESFSLNWKEKSKNIGAGEKKK